MGMAAMYGRLVLTNCQCWSMYILYIQDIKLFGMKSVIMQIIVKGCATKLWSGARFNLDLYDQLLL